jgi:hypothetical protein
MPKWSPADLQRIRERIEQAHLRAQASRPKDLAPNPPPKYDDVYFSGAAWLDSLSYSDSWDAPERTAADAKLRLTSPPGMERAASRRKGVKTVPSPGGTR